MLIHPAWYHRQFTTDETVTLTGAQPTQIEYLVRSELVTPAQPASRRGVSRKYDLHNCIEIAVAIELLASGIPARDIHVALVQLRQQWGRVLEGNHDETQGPAEILLVHRAPLSGLRRSSDLSIEIVPVGRPLLILAKSRVIHACVPLETIVRNVLSKVFALEQWKDSRPT